MDYWTKADIKLPKIGLGTWQMEGESCTEAVKTALEIGYRHIDTAQFYDNEEYVGKAISESSVSREDIFLTTKIWKDSLELKEVLISTSKSLEKLKVDYLDLLLIHWPNSQIPLDESLSAMAELTETKKVRKVGLSNFTIPLMKQALKINKDLICNQVEYHPFLDQSKMQKELTKSNMFLTAYSPLARGAVLKNPVLKTIAQKYNKTTSQVALRWLIQKENVVAIPKSENKENLAENINIFDFELSAEDCVQIDKLKDKNKRLIDPDFAPDWDK